MKTHFHILALATITLIGLGSSSLQADEPPSPALRLIGVIDLTNAGIQQAKASFVPVLDTFRKQGVPEEGIQEISAAAERFFSKTFSDPDLVVEMAKIYSQIFTDQEIEELITFYQTPVGRKTITSMPSVMGQCNQVGQQFAKKNQAAFQEELKALLAKYPKTPAAEKPGQ